MLKSLGVTRGVMCSLERCDHVAEVVIPAS